MSNMENKEISTYLDEAMMEYSAYVLLHRAIPKLTDGLKPSYTRILYTMSKNNMTSLIKSANVVGRVMEVHPHGSSYPTIVNMVQKDTNNIPWIIGKGNFAQHTSRDMQPADARYTEIKLSPYAIDMMKNLKKDIVDMKPTFDGASIEPVELPVQHPQILTISQQGLGVGFSTNIPSFNLTEVCQATIDYIEKGEIPVLIPDLATGGYILNNPHQFQIINETGKGSFKIRARYEIDGQYILIKEIPFTTTREEIIDKIVELVKAGKLKDIVDIKDTTDIKGMEIEIKVRKSTNPESIMKLLYAMTPLESSFAVNMTVLDNNRPKLLGVTKIIPKWVDWRRNCIKRWLTFEVKEKQEKLHILKGLEKCLLDVDKVIEIIKTSNEDVVIENLCNFFNIDEVQAEEVASMKLKEINKDKILKKTQSIKSLEQEIINTQEIIKSTEKLDNLVIDGLRETMNKYGHERRSIIVSDTIISNEDLIEDYNCQLVVTSQWYVKKTLRYMENQKVKDGDSVVSQTPTTNKSKLLVFTDKANCYFYNLHELPETAPSNLGQYFPSLLPIEEDEKIIYVTSTADFSGHMYFSFTNGKVTKVPLTSYQTKQNRSKLMNSYNTESPLIFIGHYTQDVDFLSKSSDGYYFLASSSLINEKTTRNSQGVTFQKLHPDCKVVEFGINNLSNLESRTCTYDSLAKIGKKLNL